MYYDRKLEIKDKTNKQFDSFMRLFRNKTRKSSWFVGTSPLALAACGGGSNDGQADAIVRTLVAGTDSADLFENSSSNEKIEGGLGDDIFVVDFGGGNDLITDTGGNDTLKIVFRDAENNAQLDTMYKDGSDLVIEMRDGQTTTTIEDAFEGDNAIETINAFHAGGNWGEGILGNLYLLDDENIATGDHVAVGTNTADTYDSTADGKNGLAIFAAGGDDTITTGDGTQYIFGGAGDDILNGGEGDDTVLGEAGDDTIYMSPGVDQEDGGEGTDTLILGDWAGSYSGTLNLENGDNFAAGGDGSTSKHKVYNFENVTTQNTGNMTIVGTDGDNIIQTGAGDDNITAGDGDDIIYAGDGDDSVDAGAGDDVVNNNTSGTDYFNGGDGIDTYAVDVNFTIDWRLEVDLESEYSGIEGQYGADLMDTIINFENVTIQAGVTVVIMGDEKANVLTGGTQSDEIGGRSESDTLTGNGGADTFVFAQSDTGTDTITDFDLAEGDKLDLSSYGITTEEAAEALMSDSSDGVNVTIDGNIIVTISGLNVADFAAADGWLA